MEEKKNQVLYKWLEIDLVNIAEKMGLSDKSCDANLELLMDTIRCLDYESIVVEKPSVNYIITVIGLMWEHVDHTKFDLRKFVIKILSRIGYPTSAIICDKDFDKENGTFSGIDSWIDEVALTINQMKNEIMVADQKYLLTDYQKQIWDSMDNDKVLGIEDILFCLRVKIYNNSCVIKQNIRFIEARKHTNDSYLISRYEDYTAEIEQIKKLLAEIWNIPYGITIYAKHNRKAFVQLRILELLLSDNIGRIELDECNKPALTKIDLTQSNSELKREFMIKWMHCISQVDGITRYLKYMNKKMMRYQRLITNVTDVKELKEIVENIKD